MKIYLTGQNNFGNRGCEALVRSTIDVMRQRFGSDTRFLVPSLDIARDQAQWPDAANFGVQFVRSPAVPTRYINWGRLCAKLGFLNHLPWPAFQPDDALREHLHTCDLLLSIGGDNYSLDYDLASLFFFVAIAEYMLDQGKPAVLWGASVGPFSAIPAVERRMVQHLRKLTAVTVRESCSIEYLRSLGVVNNVVSVADSAFVMVPQKVELESFWPRKQGQGVLGFNVSPLIERVRSQSGQGGTLKAETVNFIRSVISKHDYSVLLVPHVAPLDGATRNNDEIFMAAILDELADVRDRVGMVPSGKNAPELKYIISQCRFFIGARTHATIAAFSTGVPTISIAYSVKAKGLNRDLFDTERYVLETPRVACDSLQHSLELLIQDEQALRDCLAQRMPLWRQRATAGAEWLDQKLQRV